MSKDDLTRVRNDLETMESAIGLPPRWDANEIRINLLFAAAGLAAVAWALLPHGLSPLVGLCFLLVPVIAWARTGTTGESPVAGREFRSALRTVWLAIPLVALFGWSRQVGLTATEFLSLSIFLIGAILFSAAVGEKQMNSLLGWAAALMTGALLLPLGAGHIVAVFAATLVMGGLLSALFAYANRERQASHAAG